MEVRPLTADERDLLLRECAELLRDVRARIKGLEEVKHPPLGGYAATPTSEFEWHDHPVPGGKL